MINIVRHFVNWLRAAIGKLAGMREPAHSLPKWSDDGDSWPLEANPRDRWL